MVSYQSHHDKKKENEQNEEFYALDMQIFKITDCRRRQYHPERNLYNAWIGSADYKCPSQGKVFYKHM
jgi:hypothetical protein